MGYNFLSKILEFLSKRCDPVVAHTISHTDFVWGWEMTRMWSNPARPFLHFFILFFTTNKIFFYWHNTEDFLLEGRGVEGEDES